MPLAHLGGELSEGEARTQTVTTTRRSVRRQRAWFRRDPRVHWLNRDGTGLAATLELLSSQAPG